MIALHRENDKDKKKEERRKEKGIHIYFLHVQENTYTKPASEL